MEAIHSAKDPVWKLNKFKLLWTHINLIHSFIHAVLNFFIWKSTNVQCVTSRKTAQKLFFLSITHSVCKSTIQFVLLFYFTALPLYDFVIVVGFFVVLLLLLLCYSVCFDCNCWCNRICTDVFVRNRSGSTKRHLNAWNSKRIPVWNSLMKR